MSTFAVISAIGSFVGLLGTSMYFYKKFRYKFANGPEKWRMAGGKVLRRVRCKKCNVTFPPIKATKNMVNIPYQSRMLVC